MFSAITGNFTEQTICCEKWAASVGMFCLRIHVADWVSYLYINYKENDIYHFNFWLFYFLNLLGIFLSVIVTSKSAPFFLSDTYKPNWADQEQPSFCTVEGLLSMFLHHICYYKFCVFSLFFFFLVVHWSQSSQSFMLVHKWGLQFQIFLEPLLWKKSNSKISDDHTQERW